MMDAILSHLNEEGVMYLSYNIIYLDLSPKQTATIFTFINYHLLNCSQSFYYVFSMITQLFV